jgi:hypothetical protein
MSKLNPQRFSTEEFPEQQDWISKLFQPLNQFTDEVVRAFSNSFNIEDNLFQEIKEIKYVNSASNFPLKFRTKFNSSPKGLSVIYLFNNTTGSYSALQPWVVWSFKNNEIEITSISGLTAASTYTIRLLAFYG